MIKSKHSKCGTCQQEQAAGAPGFEKNAERKTMKRPKSLVSSLCAIAGFVLLAGAPVAFAAGPYVQIGTIAVPGGLSQFDIMWVDTSSDLMYFADDGAALGAGAVDVFDVHNDKFLYKLGLGSFRGLYDATHCCNGPTGVLPVTPQREIWAGDGNSTIKVINMDNGEIVNTINTGGVNRADEMAWDSKDHLLIIGNSSEPSVNFLTVINTDTQKIQGTINYPNSTGLEQPVWDPQAERFYVPIDGTNTEVDVIDPTKVVGSCTVTGGPACGVTSQMFPSTSACPSISGMALLPGERLMLSCGMILNVPSGSTAATLQSSTGAALSGDEIYYNAGDGQVYWGTGTPWVVNVGGGTNQVSQLAPTKAGSHIVAANSNNNHIYLPSSVCGCVEVFAPASDFPAGSTPFSH